MQIVQVEFLLTDDSGAACAALVNKLDKQDGLPKFYWSQREPSAEEIDDAQAIGLIADTA